MKIERLFVRQDVRIRNATEDKLEKVRDHILAKLKETYERYRVTVYGTNWSISSEFFLPKFCFVIRYLAEGTEPLSITI